VGALSAIMTVSPMRPRPKWPKSSGPSRLQEERRHMLRVIRNHRRAAPWRIAGIMRGSAVSPVPLDTPLAGKPTSSSAPRPPWDRRGTGEIKRLRKRAGKPWSRPTGNHFGLVMDCDTTGIEPDFPLEFAMGGRAVVADHPQHCGRRSSCSPGRPELFGHFGRGA